MNKAELLVEAIDVASAATSRRRGTGPTRPFGMYLTDLNRRYAERADLRALLLKGPTAARNDAGRPRTAAAEQGDG